MYCTNTGNKARGQWSCKAKNNLLNLLRPYVTLISQKSEKQVAAFSVSDLLIRIFSIPDPGVKKAPPGPGSATLAAVKKADLCSFFRRV